MKFKLGSYSRLVVTYFNSRNSKLKQSRLDQGALTFYTIRNMLDSRYYVYLDQFARLVCFSLFVAGLFLDHPIFKKKKTLIRTLGPTCQWVTQNQTKSNNDRLAKDRWINLTIFLTCILFS